MFRRMMPPKISIIIPAHNEENYLRQTLHSIKNQTFQDYETIVVANGCTDGTERLVIKRADDKLKLFSLPQANVSLARNKGAEMAQGDILLFLDADTLLEPEVLQKINQDFLENYAIATTKVKPDDDQLRYNFLMAAKNFYNRTGLYTASSGALICRKDDFDSVGGYNPELKVMEHRELIHKLRSKGKKICLDAYTITSMRRFKQWSIPKAAGFWIRQWINNSFGDLKKSEYEKIR